MQHLHSCACLLAIGLACTPRSVKDAHEESPLTADERSAVVKASLTELILSLPARIARVDSSALVRVPIIWNGQQIAQVQTVVHFRQDTSVRATVGEHSSGIMLIALNPDSLVEIIATGASSMVLDEFQPDDLVIRCRERRRDKQWPSLLLMVKSQADSGSLNGYVMLRDDRVIPLTGCWRREEQ